MIRLAERLRPRSVTAQITGLVVAALLIAHLLTAVVLVSDRRPPPPGIGPGETAMQVATIARLAGQAAQPEAVAAILTAAQRAGIDIVQVPTGELVPPPSPDERGAHFAADVRRGLGPDYRVAVSQVGLERARGLGVVVARADAALALRFQVTLPPPPAAGPPPPRWLPPLVPTLAVIGVSVLLLSVYAVRAIIAPLSAIADAASSFGQPGVPPHPLPETGPVEIAQVAHALNGMRERVGRMVDERTRMLVALSHDLRTPLTRLRLRIERVPTAEGRDGMLREVAGIDAMLRGSLEYLRGAVAEAEAFEPTDLPSLLRTVCDAFADVGHAVLYRGPLRLVFDCRPEAIGRAVSNVVDNATKHADRVVVRLEPDPGGGVRIVVADDGPGIPSALRAAALEPFFKADGARGGSGGFGLGLAIARDIVRAHGGVIRLADNAPRGLVVVLALPGGRAADPGTTPAQSDREALERNAFLSA